MDVVVSQLPLVSNINKIKTRLKKLCEPFGGKVMSIQGPFAIIRFANKDAAIWATKKMSGENVCGSKIQVLYSTQIEKSPGEQRKTWGHHQNQQDYCPHHHNHHHDFCRDSRFSSFSPSSSVQTFQQNSGNRHKGGHQNGNGRLNSTVKNPNGISLQKRRDKLKFIR